MPLFTPTLASGLVYFLRFLGAVLLMQGTLAWAAAAGRDAPPAPREIVFIAGDVADPHTLLQGFRPGLRTYLLDASQDGLAQMARILGSGDPVDAIHLVSHGASAELHLGSLTLTQSNLPDHAGALHAIRQALRPDGELLVYGCDVASGQRGADFLTALAQSTGATVAASANATGAAGLGGDWVLEHATGTLRTASLENQGYSHLLAASGTITFTAAPTPATVIARDGDGGSVDIPGITIEITGSQNQPWTYETPYSGGASGLAQGYAANASSSLITIKSSTGTPFSFDAISTVDYGGVNITVEGFRGNASTGSVALDVGANNWENTFTATNGLTPSTFSNVDEVRITPQSGFQMWITVNNIGISHSSPIVTTNAATGLTTNGATLNATVSDNGFSTAVSFEYGTTTAYGSSVAATTGATVPANAGNTAASVALTGLACNTTYHYRAKGVNSEGTGYGADAAFTTAACVPGAPTIGIATPGDAQASVSFSPPASNGGAAIVMYTATSSPGNFTGSSSSSPITVNGLSNGTAYTFTVTATNSAGTGPASAASGSVTPRANQTITFNPPASQVYGTAPTLTATATSGLTVTFTSSTPGVCTITTGGTLSFSSTGSCTVSADQSGDFANNAAATQTRTFTVTANVPGAPTIGSATAGNAQASVTFTAPANNGGAAITGYTATSNPGGFTGTGASSPITVAGLTNGTAYTFTVTATNSIGTGAASAASNSATPKSTQTITFGNPGPQNFGTSPTLTATSSSSLPVTFTSATSGVCTITSGGTLTFVTSGSCTINADQGGNSSYQAATQVSRTFTVNAVPPAAPVIGTATAGDTQATVAFSAPAFNGGSTVTGYTVTANPGGNTGSGASSPITVTGLTNGVAYTFTVTAENAAGLSSASAASNSVTPAATQTITFNNPGRQNFGTAPTLTATSDSGLTPVFTSSTTAVCTIMSTGELTFIATGSCTINANQSGNASYLPAPQVSRTFAIDAVAPATPAAPVATAGNNQASVSFTPPASDGGSAITVYTVTASPGGATASGAASPLVVTGLTNGQTYTFTVRATNGIGTSAPSAASAPITLTVRTVSGPVPGMAGTATATLTGGGSACTLEPASSGFSSASGSAPAGTTLPYGQYAFQASSCATSVTMTLTYPEALPANVQFLKYGPPTAAVGGVVAPSSWFPLAGVTVSPDRKTVSYTLIDNGVGDSDGSIGSIRDPFAPALVPPAAGVNSIPVDAPWALAALSALLAALAWRRRELKPRNTAH